MKKFIRKNLINSLKILPFDFREKIINIFSDTFKSKDGMVNNKSIFDFKEIQGLAPKSEYIEIYKKCLIRAGDQKTDNIYKLLRHLNLYSYVEDVLTRKIEGDFAECGCWNGNSLFATKLLIDKYDSNKAIHVFDSFEGGLSDFKEEDIEGGSFFTNEMIQTIRNQFKSSYLKLSNETKSLKNIYLNKGWIPEVFRSQKDRPYSFVHVDVDLYEPTFESHKYFFERLTKGGIIICDDYGYKQFPGSTRAVERFIDSIPRSSYSHFFKHSFGTSVLIK